MDKYCSLQAGQGNKVADERAIKEKPSLLIEASNKASQPKINFSRKKGGKEG